MTRATYVRIWSQANVCICTSCEHSNKQTTQQQQQQKKKTHTPLAVGVGFNGAHHTNCIQNLCDCVRTDFFRRRILISFFFSACFFFAVCIRLFRLFRLLRHSKIMPKEDRKYRTKKNIIIAHDLHL